MKKVVSLYVALVRAMLPVFPARSRSLVRPNC
jgi:hypothetical protein